MREGLRKMLVPLAVEGTGCVLPSSLRVHQFRGYFSVAYGKNVHAAEVPRLAVAHLAIDPSHDVLSPLMITSSVSNRVLDFARTILASTRPRRPCPRCAAHWVPVECLQTRCHLSGTSLTHRRRAGRMPRGASNGRPGLFFLWARGRIMDHWNLFECGDFLRGSLASRTVVVNAKVLL